MIGTALFLAGLALTCTVTAILLALAGPSVHSARPLPTPTPRLRRLFRRARRRADR